MGETRNLLQDVLNGILTDEEAYSLIDKYPGNKKVNKSSLKRAREHYIRSLKTLNRKIVFYLQSNNNELGMLLATKLSEYFNNKDNKPTKPFITDIGNKKLNRIYNEYKDENSIIINNYDKNKDFNKSFPHWFKTSFEQSRKPHYQYNVYKNKRIISNYYFFVNETKYEHFINNLTEIPDLNNSQTYLNYSKSEINTFKSFNVSARRRFNFIIELIEDGNNYIVSIYEDGGLDLLEKVGIKNFTLNYEDLNNKEISNNIKELGNYFLNKYDNLLN